MDYTDHRSDEERMSPAELRVAREFLGLSGAALARLLHVSDRTIRYWEEGRFPIPPGVRHDMQQIAAETASVVAVHVEKITGRPDPVMFTYRSDGEYRAAHPGDRYPASWHRAVAGRVAQEIPGLTIAYPPERISGAAPRPTQVA